MRRRATAILVLLVLAAPSARAAILLITNLNDAAAGSLRQAVQDAAAGDTIRFAPGLTGTITNLSTPYEVFVPGTIVGPGADVLAGRRGTAPIPGTAGTGRGGRFRPASISPAWSPGHGR